MSKFLFKMPNVPEEFGVILAQPELRRCTRTSFLQTSWNP